MKKRNRISSILGSLSLLLVIIAALILPAGMAFAETPDSVSLVVVDVGGTGIGTPFQHHTFIDDGIHWLFYLDYDNVSRRDRWICSED